ncbi:hypothetical protein Pmani_032821 [Petrolisthes manimaculis]|uniref:Uncharacterized protein n=1 Tax=Petrolisthes manimaculis TaxID=1843537 RepID=A0AAE1TTD8_9EUCA|nr:hypothetical protein Pmani_032821 [Petrolisthes manimaculis]
MIRRMNIDQYPLISDHLKTMALCALSVPAAEQSDKCLHHQCQLRIEKPYFAPQHHSARASDLKQQWQNINNQGSSSNGVDFLQNTTF